MGLKSSPPPTKSSPALSWQPVYTLLCQGARPPHPSPGDGLAGAPNGGRPGNMGIVGACWLVLGGLVGQPGRVVLAGRRWVLPAVGLMGVPAMAVGL